MFYNYKKYYMITIQIKRKNQKFKDYQNFLFIIKVHYYQINLSYFNLKRQIKIVKLQFKLCLVNCSNHY
jgi:hypothetical protein